MNANPDNPLTPRVFQLLIAICMIALLAGTAKALELDNQTLRYKVSYTGQNAGELEVIIEHNGDSAKTTTIAHLSGLASMFLASQTIETWFSIEDDELIVQRGQTIATKSGSVKGTFEIDRSNGLIKFDDGEEASTHPTDLFESTSFPLVLMTTKMRKVAGSTIREINARRVRTYVYLPLEKTTIEQDGRSYNVWKASRHRQGDPTRVATFWLDMDRDNVPVRIETAKKGKSTIMTLIEG